MSNPEEFRDPNEPEESSEHGEFPNEDSPDEEGFPIPENFGSEVGEGDFKEVPAESRNLEEREVHIVGVYTQQTDPADTSMGSPFVLLRDNKGRCVMIWIGRYEAIAITIGLEKQVSERPQTHDLLRNMIDKLGAKLDRIVIDDLWGDTFYAKLWMQLNGKSITVDSRPSDAVALAVRTQTQIYMTEAVLEEAGKPFEDFEQMG